MFWELIDKLYEDVVIILQESRIVTEYRESVLTASYYPSLSMLEEWMQIEFTVEYEDLLTKNTATSMRNFMKVVFKNCLKKLENLSQKRKAYKFIGNLFICIQYVVF